MPYSELIKDFNKIRAYIREFSIYGFRSRDEFDAKSARSYDNERRRVESWLGKYMRFRQDATGKQIFLSLDSRQIAQNPIYQAFRTKSFTDMDIVLHFFLLDMLRGQALTAREATDCLCREYLRYAPDFAMPDESTVRKKLKEYERLGLLTAEKQGREIVYCAARNTMDRAVWQDAIAFFAEDAPLGVIGSTLPHDNPFFRFKHRYLLDALDSEIMLSLLGAMHRDRTVELTIFSRRKQTQWVHTLFPLRFFISTQTGRQYLLGYHQRFRKPMFFRLDSIRSVKEGAVETRADEYRGYLQKFQENLWGVSTGDEFSLDHLELDIHVGPDEQFLVDRLRRERRCGAVAQVDEQTWRFSADVYDAGEMLPWLRTFIGRIVRLQCSNSFVTQRFYADLEALNQLYGGDGDAVQ